MTDKRFNLRARHLRWHAVDDLPGDRIMRRQADGDGWEYEFVDHHDTVLGWLNRQSHRFDSPGDLSIGPAAYTCTKTGLLDKYGEVVLPWHRQRWRDRPKFSCSRLLSGLANFFSDSSRVMDMPHGSTFEFWYHASNWTTRWSVGEILNESNQALLTFRWRAEDLSRRQMLGPGSISRHRRLGEAVVAPGHRLPVDPLLLTTCGFWIFDGLSVGGQGVPSV